MKSKEIPKQPDIRISKVRQDPLGRVDITTYKFSTDGDQVTTAKFKVVDGNNVYTIDKKTFTVTKEKCYIVIEKRKLVLNDSGGQCVLSCLCLDNQGEVRGWTR